MMRRTVGIFVLWGVAVLSHICRDLVGDELPFRKPGA